LTDLGDTLIPVLDYWDEEHKEKPPYQNQIDMGAFYV